MAPPCRRDRGRSSHGVPAHAATHAAGASGWPQAEAADGRFLDDAIDIEDDYDAGFNWAYEGVHRAPEPSLQNFKDSLFLDLQKAKVHAGRGRAALRPHAAYGPRGCNRRWSRRGPLDRCIFRCTAPVAPGAVVPLLCRTRPHGRDAASVLFSAFAACEIAFSLGGSCALSFAAHDYNDARCL